jgi:hypothetical protein
MKKILNTSSQSLLPGRVFFIATTCLYLFTLYFFSDIVLNYHKHFYGLYERPKWKFFAFTAFLVIIFLPILLISTITKHFFFPRSKILSRKNALESYIFNQTKDDSPIEIITAARRELDLPEGYKKGIFADFFQELVDNLNNVQYHSDIESYQSFLTLSKKSINYFEGDELLLTIPTTEVVCLEALEKETTDLYIKHKSSEESLSFAAVELQLKNNTVQNFVISRNLVNPIDKFISSTRSNLI